MKSKILTTLCALAFATSGYAEFTVSGHNSDSKYIDSISGSGTVTELLSAIDKYKTDNSLENITGVIVRTTPLNVTVDAASSDLRSLKNWLPRGSSASVATFDFGSTGNTLLIGSFSGDQHSSGCSMVFKGGTNKVRLRVQDTNGGYLDVNVQNGTIWDSSALNGDVVAKSFKADGAGSQLYGKVLFSQAGSYDITNGADFSVANGGYISGATSDIAVNISSGSTFNALGGFVSSGKAVNFSISNATATFGVENSTTAYSSTINSLTADSTSDVTINKNYTLTTTTLTGTADNPIGSLTISGNLINQDTSTAVYVKTIDIKSGASAILGRNLWVSNTLTVGSSNESVTVRKILPMANSKIILNGENAVKYQYSTEDASMIASCYTGATVELGANQKFGKLIMSAATGTTLADLTIDFGGNSIAFDAFSNDKADASYNLYLKDFESGNFLLKDTSGLDLDKVFVIDEAGNTLFTGDQLQWSSVANSNNYYSLNTVAVPEPAEWAAIFGAIALGFVAYRRRK